MKKFFNVFTVIMLIVFLGGLVSTAVSGNWTAFIWVFIGALWMLMARNHEVVRDRIIEENEAEVAELSHLHSELDKKYNETVRKYDAKLKENYDLTCENKRLSEELLRHTKDAGSETLGNQVPAAPHGNIKLKTRRKKPVQDKA